MALALYKENNLDIPAYQYVDDGNPPVGYTATDDPIDWDEAFRISGLLGTVDLPHYTSFRDNISLAYIALGAPTDAQKIIASQWFVVDKAVRDSVLSQAQQQIDADNFSLNVTGQKYQESEEFCALDTVDADVLDINDHVALMLSKWQPPTTMIGDFIPLGVTVYAASGAGAIYSFEAGVDDVILGNLDLDHSGISPYAGQKLAFHIHWMIYTAPAPNTNVKWELRYAFTSDGDDNDTVLGGTKILDIDVSGRNEREQYTDTFDFIAGASGANTLQLRLTRNSTGAGADNYAGDSDLYGLGLKIVEA